MKAIRISGFGEPRDVLHLADMPEPAPAGPHEVLVQLEASPLNLNDLYVARGAFAVLPQPPGPIGNEGVGRVIALGAEVTNVAVGDRVLLPVFSWIWRERMNVPAKGLFALPDADLHQLAMLEINPPTASLLLSDYAALKLGDWIIQNAANSGVGRAVIAIARARGLKSINIVRRAELVAELHAAGGDVVMVEGQTRRGTALSAVNGGTIGLGIDAVGGVGTGLIASIVSAGEAVVAYSVLGDTIISSSALDSIFKQVSIHGFYLAIPNPPRLPRQQSGTSYHLSYPARSIPHQWGVSAFSHRRCRCARRQGRARFPGCLIGKRHAD